jgi:glycosyltransferase involved in cell wall biosynthesis
LRIIHVFHSYYPAVGGMERFVQNISEEQAKLGHEVHVITSYNVARSRPAEEKLNKVYVHRARSLRLGYPDLTYPLDYPMEVLKNADVIHGHSHNSLFTVKVIEKAKKLGVRTAIHFIAVDALNDHPNPLVRLIGPHYSMWVLLKAIKSGDLKLVMSYRDKEILRSKYNVDAVYVPVGIPECYFTAEKADPNEFRKKFGIKQEKIFLFIGRIHKLKGPHILVKALKYVEEDVAVVFIGPDDGYLKETLDLVERIGVKDRVYMLGYVDEEIKMKALDSATALILPSIADYVEIYPTVISEAWAREKPVIASKIGGIPYRVKQDVNGVLVNPSDPKMLAEAMLKVAHNDEIAKEMGRNGRKDVFSCKEIAAKLIKLYEQVLENK